MDVSHIGYDVLAAFRFGDFIKDFPVIADTERHSAVIALSTLILPDELEASRETSHSLIEFPLGEIFRINIRVLCGAHFAVSNNGSVVNTD